VEQSKGRKDRNVMLWPEMLDLLRQWWKVTPLNAQPAARAIASYNPQRAQLQQLTGPRWTAQSSLDQLRSHFAGAAPVLKSP
jgi:hypothetical protein